MADGRQEELIETQKQNAGNYLISARWWFEQEREKVWPAVIARLQHIRDRQEGRRKEQLLYASLYGNLPRLGFGLNSYTRIAGASRVVLNVCQSATDTLIAKMSKDRPRPMFATDGADFEVRKRAEQLDKYVEGKFDELDFYDSAEGPLLDTGVYGSGFLKIYQRDDDVAIDRVFPWEISVDEREAIYDNPRTIYQRKYYDRAILAEMYPDYREQIYKATLEREPEDFDYDNTCDQVLVCESWHLPSSARAGDGKHAICIQGATLEWEDYTETDFPFERVRLIKPPMGWWGIGVVERIAGLQLEINKLLRDVQQAQHLIGRPHWMVESNAKVMTQHLNNDIATIIKYQGSVPPQVYVPQAMPPEVYSHMQFLYAKAFEVAGVSQLSANAQKPAGLNSGRAMRTYADIENERFSNFARAYQRFVVGAAKKIIAIERKIAGRKKSRVVKYADKNAFTAINWKDVDLKEDQYVLKVYPVNLLPRTPEGKLSFVEDLLNAKMISPDEGMELLDWPDTDKFSKRRHAPRRLIEKHITQMQRGEEASPDGLMNLQLAREMVTSAYNEASADDAPETTLQVLRDYLVAISALEEPPPQPEQAAPPPGPPPMPPGLPPGPETPPPPEGPPPGAMLS